MLALRPIKRDCLSERSIAMKSFQSIWNNQTKKKCKSMKLDSLIQMARLIFNS